MLNVRLGLIADSGNFCRLVGNLTQKGIRIILQYQLLTRQNSRISLVARCTWEMAGQPLWRLGAEAGFLSEESTGMTHELERWMVPNKLPLLRLTQYAVF